MYFQQPRFSREESHDFYTEGFPATIKFIRDHFQTRKLTCTAAEVCTEANFTQDMCLFVYFLLPVVFADCRRTNINLTFSFQKRRMSREFIIRSLEVGKVWQESQVSGARAGSLFIIFVARERI